jgi:hypothetical protein
MSQKITKDNYLLYLVSVIAFVYLFVNYSNNIPHQVQEFLSDYKIQLAIAILLLLFVIYIDRYVGLLLFILFFIQFRRSIKN